MARRRRRTTTSTRMIDSPLGPPSRECVADCRSERRGCGADAVAEYRDAQKECRDNEKKCVEECRPPLYRTPPVRAAPSK